MIDLLSVPSPDTCKRIAELRKTLGFGQWRDDLMWQETQGKYLLRPLEGYPNQRGIPAPNKRRLRVWVENITFILGVDLGKMVRGYKTQFAQMSEAEVLGWLYVRLLEQERWEESLEKNESG